MEYVAGYMNGHDVSARGLGFFKSWVNNGCGENEMFARRWLVTPANSRDSRNLAVKFRLNGKPMQNSSNGELIFGIDGSIAYISQIATLDRRPDFHLHAARGSGMARKPPVF